MDSSTPPLRDRDLIARARMPVYEQVLDVLGDILFDTDELMDILRSETTSADYRWLGPEVELIYKHAGGRMTTIVETTGGHASTTTYGYDDAGRLGIVTRNGVQTAAYSYDSNGNRLPGSYDAQDRLLASDGVTYTYTHNGELATKSDATGTTSYSYDGFGNLRSVALPDGKRLEYIVDGQQRRIGKKVDGVVVTAWLYADQQRIVAETNGSGVVTKRFVFASRTNVPDFVISNGVTYRIITDHVGSPRFVMESSVGTVVDEIAYDTFGRVLADSNPGFIPFGFAGGLYDADTGLVHFGERDYDPQTGRWMTKDPIGFTGGDANLYAYCGHDPVNKVDPDGTVAVAAVATLAAGGTAAAAAGAAITVIASGVAVGTAIWDTQQLLEELAKQAAAEELLRDTIRRAAESRRAGRKPVQPGKDCPRPNEKYRRPLPPNPPPEPPAPKDPRNPPVEPPLMPRRLGRGGTTVKSLIDGIINILSGGLGTDGGMDPPAGL